jgi:ABC-type uncharacterized transport system permease subunit
MIDGVIAIGGGLFTLLVPKCPLCFAAYFTFATGIGLATGTAQMVRWSLLGLAISMFAFGVTRFLLRAIANRQGTLTVVNCEKRD